MPTWKKEELPWECFHLIYPKFYENKSKFDEAYEIWGGSPHLHIFNVVTKVFTEVLRSPELLDMVEDIGGTDRYQLNTRVQSYQ